MELRKSLIHDKCGGKIVISSDNNNACGDPECCGGYKEWAVLKCEKCGAKESLNDLD